MLAWIRSSLIRWLLGVTGVASCFVGALFTYKTHYEHPQYQYLPVDNEWREHLHAVIEASRKGITASGSAELVVDVSGAVDKPGVYKFSSGSRVQEAILAAGGFATKASKQFIHHELNLANTLRDKDKIYIPFEDENAVGLTSAESNLIDVNTVSVEQLDQLPGIGDQRAQSIVKNRPYADGAELQSKTKIPRSVFENIESLGYELTY